MTMNSNPIDTFLEAIEAGDISGCDAWAPAATLDATVPNWRFSVTGADAVRTTFASWFAHPGVFESVRRVVTPSGEVVEYGLSWTEDGVPYGAHHVHLIDIADGRITADTVMCGGRWPAALMAQMEEARHG